ncbi:MAG: hypothetical protein ABEH35_02840 [Haloarculaceae archaeon]
MADSLAFDRTVLAAVATEHGIGEERLRELVEDHQAGIEELPGVENLVYEWRKQFDGTVVEQTDSTYYLAVPDWVWNEFGDRLDLGEDELAALATVHERQVQARTDADGPDDGETYLLLER